MRARTHEFGREICVAMIGANWTALYIRKRGLGTGREGLRFRASEP